MFCSLFAIYFNFFVLNMDMEPKRCPNCTIRITTSVNVSLSKHQDILNLLRKWHPTRTITDTDIICRECLDVIKNTLDVETLDKPVLGHLDCCIMCGRSFVNKKVQFLKISRYIEKEASIYKAITQCKLPFDLEIGPSAKVCRACWLRVSRKIRKGEKVQDSTNSTMTDKEKKEEEDEALQEPDSTNGTITAKRKTIVLPNYKRSVIEDKCVFRSCKDSSIHEIPIRVRKNLLVKYCYYLHSKCRICKKHLDGDKWEDVVNTGVKIFTAEHIEDMIEVLKSDHLRFYSE